ncbi:MAG: amidohydrolase family protein, partial [Candidatus Omnitrophica bacterium]|nr:amidohydrolase family protein [Candidatus Omnitrophota bacterium]
LPVGEFYDNCAQEGRPINYGASAGWGFARLVTMCPEQAVNGKPVPRLAYLFDKFNIREWTESLATEAQVHKILEWTDQGLREGGLGIGVLQGYTPGAGAKEMLALWSLAAEQGVGTFTHIQNASLVDPRSSVSSMIQLMGLAASTGAHTHICHWNSTSLRDIPTIREIVENSQKAGLKVTTEAYVYGAGSSAIGASIYEPEEVEARLGVKFSDFTLVKNNKSFESKEEFIQERKAHPENLILMHYLHSDNDPQDAALLDLSVLYPGASICSDAITWIDAEGNWFESEEWPLPKGLQSHPRAAGNYCRFLRKWVRERQAITWIEAIRQSSLNGALILEDSVPSMRKKGRLQEGMDADIIVFDPETVTDNATFKEPCQPSSGMNHVIVNGTYLIRDGQLDPNAFPGRPVRRPVTA